MNYFERNGVKIETKFKLSEEQEKALTKLIDSVVNGIEPITLSGYAGSGKSSLIKYLELYLNSSSIKRFNFIYAAPTHAATVYLGLNLGYLPFTIQSIMVNRLNNNNEYIKVFSKKFNKALSETKRNVLVVDEASMLSREDVSNLIRLCIENNIKIVFLGDKAQIPEITKEKKKHVSDVFTKIENITLSKVFRTSDDTILKILTEIRNNPNGYLPITDNTEKLVFYDSIDKELFFNNFIDRYKKEPNETVFISYTNNVVKSFNKKVRDTLYGEDSDGLIIGETIVGYGGYNTKKILSENLANSVKYIVTEIIIKDSVVFVKGKSDRLKQIKESYGNMHTKYYQLSEDDSIKIKSFGENDFERNNARVSNIFRKLYEYKKSAIENGYWVSFFNFMEEFNTTISSVDLGNNYIYNYEENRMEIFDSKNKKHKEIIKEFPELYIEKGIDYGYAITIHKSQGATYNNVFFNSVSTESNNNPLFENDKQVGTEGNSLNYVGMSRAAKELHVMYGNKIKFI